MDKKCVGCGGALETGTVKARNTTTLVPDVARIWEVAFVRPGVPTAPNFIGALLQGLKDAPDDQYLPVTAYRCTACGRLELYAEEG